MLAALAGAGPSAGAGAIAPSGTPVLDASASTQAATVSPDFLSFGIDASQLLTRNGGQPFDFTRPALRNLTRPLSPAYIRFSGTKIDQTYVDLSGADPPTIPTGYLYGITRDEWDRANAFAQDLGLGVVAGVNGGPGPRAADGTWDPTAGRALLQYSADHGFPIVATSFGNEPNITYYGSGLPSTYDAQQYATDEQAFAAISRQILPAAKVIGPGSFFSTGAEKPLNGATLGPDTTDIMGLLSGAYDAVSYHSYPAFASTCAAPLTPTLPDDPLSAEFLDRPGGPLATMTSLRNQDDPGKPLWVDEASSVACGGVVGYSDRFAASFYYLSFLGTLARGGVQVAIRWTLAGPPSQPYSLIDNATLTPRPDYWAAVLWKKLMGTTVLTPAVTAPPPTLRTYAQCTPGSTGGVTAVALNTSRTAPQTLTISGTGASGASAYVVTGDLAGTDVALNGQVLVAGADGSIPALTPVPVVGGAVTLPPASYAFVTEPLAAAAACGAIPAVPKLSAPKQKLRTVARRHQLAARCALPSAGLCTVVATVPAATARRLRLTVTKGAKVLTLATAATPVGASGAATVRLRLARRAARALGRSRTTVPVTLTATSAVANWVPSTAGRSITLGR